MYSDHLRSLFPHSTQILQEKLIRNGPESLSDLELLECVIAKGGQAHSSKANARSLMKLYQSGEPLTLRNLSAIQGIGTARASLLLAALEFSKRRFASDGELIESPEDAVRILAHYAQQKQEYFVTITLNGARRILSTRVITIGLVDQTQVHPREVFASALQERASAMIVAHNHPSGVFAPSDEDKAVTRRLSDAGRLLGIMLIDHLILCRDNYFSFAAEAPKYLSPE